MVKDKRHEQSYLILKTIYVVVILFLLVTLLPGCATTCSPNPESMCHMSAKELNERLGL